MRSPSTTVAREDRSQFWPDSKRVRRHVTSITGRLRIFSYR